MKNKLYIFVILLLVNTINTFSQVTYTTAKKLGINRTPSYTLDVEGTVRFSNWKDVIINWTGASSSPVIYPETDWYLHLGKESNRIGKAYFCDAYAINYNNYSDEKIKENINPIDSSLQKIMNIQGVTYRIKKDFISSAPIDIQNKYQSNQFGFIAQELGKTFPELIFKTDSLGLFAVNYIGLIPVLVEAIQEQQKIIEKQGKKIYELEQKELIKNNLKSDFQDNSEIIEYSIINKITAKIEQNNPNPFNEKTEISYYLPEDTKNAFIYIYNMNGNQLKSFPLTNCGTGSIYINASELVPGMYFYSLIVDGKEIDTKKMILTKN